MNKKLLSIVLVASLFLGASCSQNNIFTDIDTNIEADNIENFENQYSDLRERDSLALVSFYRRTNGNNWFRHKNWLSEAPISKWEGVETKQINGEERVWALWLGGNHITGNFPNVLHNLSELRALQLKHNYELTGNIPEGIYSLSNLRTLDLSFTGITGELSSKIGNLREIDSLDLWTGPWDLVNSNGNYLPNPRRMSGELPKEIGLLSKARLIRVRNQNFSGELPETLGGLSNVEELSLERCDFSGPIPKSLGNLKKMRILYLAGNKLTGEIPAELCNATALEELFLRENALTGSIPTDIDKLQKLNLLNLSDNNLSGVLPQSIAKMKNLFKLDIKNNQFSGELPKDLGSEYQDFLHAVDIRNNNFSGELPQKVAHRMRNVDPNGYYPFSLYKKTRYYISGNKFSGVLPNDYQDVEKDKILPQQKGYEFTNFK